VDFPHLKNKKFFKIIAQGANNLIKKGLKGASNAFRKGLNGANNASKNLT